MLLTERMTRWGPSLFRYRGHVFILIVVALLLLERGAFHFPFGSHGIDLVFEICCLLVSLSGLLVRILTIGFIAPGTSGRNTRSQKARELNTTGMYSIVRNPLYLGNYFVLLGVCLLWQSYGVLLVSSLLFAALYVPIIMAEEAFLTRKFGAAYRDYAGRTPVLLPQVRLWKSPARPWSWRMVARREPDTGMAIVAVFFVVECVREYTVVGGVCAHPWWYVLLSGSLLLWGILKTLKKCTTIFDCNI
jgi:protein-S-isoprenylcysteine O-methyltransferase Ste14